MITADLFKLAMSNWATGVTIVSTMGRDGKPYGLTVSSFASVSLDPVLVLVCLDLRIGGLQSFKDSGKFGVSILAEGQDDLSTLFARKDTVRPPELYATGVTGVPIVKGSLVTLECGIKSLYEGGDHLILVGQVEAADLGTATEGRPPLLYFRGKYGKLAGS